MIQQPGVLALLATSALVAVFLGLAAGFGLRILRRWDLRSGSDLQLALERETYLVSTLVAFALAAELVSLFLFVFTADGLHGRIAGAMCAAGVLNAAPGGYATLLLKVAGCLLAGVWLILNHADTRGYDHPLIRVKYALLLVLAPLVWIEAFLAFRYFTGLKAEVITSCCGSLFSQGQAGLGGDLAGLPERTAMAVLAAALAALFVAGGVFLRTRRGGHVFALFGALAFLAGTASLVSFVSVYIYELPTHHCPFCFLQAEYGRVGYLLYGTLLGGGITGLGTGALMPFRRRASLAGLLPALQRRLVLAALLCFGLFALVVAYRVGVSFLRLGS
jgi:hypothetical protein